MDFLLFVVLLLGFAVTYLVLKITLAWCFLALAILALIYMSMRYPRGKEDWPHAIGSTLYLIVMIILMVIIFIFVGPQVQDPHNTQNSGIPVIGAQFTYVTPDPVPDAYWIWVVPLNVSTVFFLLLMFLLMFIAVFAFVIPGLAVRAPGAGKGAGGEGEGGEGSGKPKVGVGA